MHGATFGLFLMRHFAEYRLSDWIKLLFACHPRLKPCILTRIILLEPASHLTPITHPLIKWLLIIRGAYKKCANQHSCSLGLKRQVAEGSFRLFTSIGAEEGWAFVLCLDDHIADFLVMKWFICEDMAQLNFVTCYLFLQVAYLVLKPNIIVCPLLFLLLQVLLQLLQALLRGQKSFLVVLILCL